MRRIDCMALVIPVLIGCVGCGQSGTSSGPSPTPPAASSPTPPAASSPTPPSTSPTDATEPTAPAPGPTAPASTRINDTEPSVIYSKGNSSTQNWDLFQPAKEDYRQDEHSSNFVRSGGAITGAGLVVNFNGTGITWIGKKGPHYGIAAYSIDGGTPRTVDNYNSSETDQKPIAAVSGLSSDAHVLSITLLDQKRSASVGYWQTIDGFDIEGSPLTPSQATSAGYNSAELRFTGKWDGGWVKDGSDLSGGHYWSNAANASVSWTFVGSLIEVFGRPDYEDGYMDVYIDNSSTPVASVNGHWGASDDDALNSYMLFARKLKPGQHTIKLVVTGKHDKSARDSYVQLDEFVAYQ